MRVRSIKYLVSSIWWGVGGARSFSGGEGDGGGTLSSRVYSRGDPDTGLLRSTRNDGVGMAGGKM